MLDRPTLILVMGVPASGKTTLSKEILKRIGAVYLDNNFLADAFFPSTRTDPKYRELRPALYRALYRITEENLLIGNSVLLDVPHVTQMQDLRWRESLSDLVRRTSASLVIVRCLCSESTLRQRIKDRGEKRDQWKLDHWGEFMAQEPIEIEIPFQHIDINTEEEARGNAARVVQYIERVASIGRD